MILINLIKYVILILIFLNSRTLNNNHKTDVIDNFGQFIQYSLTSLSKNAINIPEIYFEVTDLNITYSKANNLIEIIYYITFFDINYQLIAPSNLSLLYNLSIICNFYTFRGHTNIYSLANIHENRIFYCVEYSKIGELAKYGIKIYQINDKGEENEYIKLFFFTDKLININNNISIQNNYKFDINYLQKKYNQLLDKFNEATNENNLLSSYIQLPLCFLKKDIPQYNGKWYFKNIYGNYFCFCKGESCLNIT